MFVHSPRASLGILFALALASAPGCGGGGSALPAGTPANTDSGFALKKDAFVFENFAVGYDASKMTPELAARMFGADKVCEGAASTADYCLPTVSARGWIDGVNASLQNGRCEGMAVMSQLMFIGDLKPAAFGAETARDLTLARNFDLQRELAYWFSTQLVPDAVQNVKLMPKDVLPFLATFLKPGATESYRIGMVQKLATGFGLSHSLTPIGYYAGEASGIYYIRVYDNNFPGGERAIKLDLKHDAWSYDGVSSTGPVPFTGGAANKNPLYFAPVHARIGTLPCPFCDEATSKTVLAAGAVQVAAKDMAGNTNGIVGGEVVESNGGSVSPGFGLCVDNQCSNGSPLVVINAPSANSAPLKLQLAPGDPAMMAAGTSTVRVGGSAATTTIRGIDTQAGTADEVTIANGGRSVTYQSGSMQPITVESAFTLRDGSVIRVVANVQGANSGLTLSVDPDTGAVSVRTDGAAGTPITIDVTRTGMGPAASVHYAKVEVTGSASGTVSFDARALATSSIIPVTVQNGTDAPQTISSNHCATHLVDADETDFDCGGATCGKCGQDFLCNVDSDCLSGVCQPKTIYDRATKQSETRNRCQTTCVSRKKDGDETDIDCGGSCAADCAAGQGCKVDTDCSGICRRDTLVCAPSPAVLVTATGDPGKGGGFDIRLRPDGTLDANTAQGGLTAINQMTVYPNTSGSYFFNTRIVGPWSVEIVRQPKGALCVPDVAAGDITGTGGLIRVNVTCTRAELPCENGTKNGQETDVDCGGADCRAEALFCATGKACLTDTDCGAPSRKAICNAGVCAATYDVGGPVSGLDPGDQVGLRIRGTLTDANAYRETTVTGRPDRLDVYYTLVNTRATGVPVTVEVSSQPAGKACTQTSTGSLGLQGTFAIAGARITCTKDDPCRDGTKGQNETDVDCGGADCRAKAFYCSEGKVCATDADCGSAGGVSRLCAANKTCVSTFDIGGTINGGFDRLELALTPAGTRDPSSTSTARTLTIPVKANPAVASTFTFTNTRVTAADTYTVSVTRAPTDATCTITNGSARASANVTSVVVDCVFNQVSSRSWATRATTGLGTAPSGHAGLYDAGPDGLIALGASTVARFDGTTWTDLGAGLDGLGLHGLAGTGPNAIWIAAESNVVRFWNGGSWFTPQSGLPGGTEVYAVAANDTIARAYLVGSGGAIAWGDVNGGDFTNEFGGGGFPGFPFPGGSSPPTTSDLHGVSMTANGHVFAAGDAGALVWTSGPGGVWQATGTAPTTRDLRGVWASGDDDAWAVGAGGTIVHFDGSDWTAVASGVTDDLFAVWGAGPNLVWAAGANGRVLFYNGQHWTPETTATTETLRAIAGVAGGETPYVFGDNNTFMQRQ